MTIMKFDMVKMSQRSKVSLWILVAALVGTAVVLIDKGFRPRLVKSIVGSVLTQDPDPRKQAPIPNVEVTAVGGAAEARSDSSGFFRLNLRTGIWQGMTLSLKFRHPDYKPLDITGQFADAICVARMVPRAGGQRAEAGGPEVLLSDIRDSRNKT